ncbi:TrgA family protein [Planktotalea sp.]|uniref:TrgA family protein n=1 Tax=Planktotalea sp. TaxID=2029877 RepID=UPI003F6AE885
MPTAARVIAALCLAALAWLVSEQIKELFEDDKPFGNFNLINTGIALVVGWQVVGSRAGRGMSAAINNGLTGGIMLFLWCSLAHGAIEMFERSMRNRYDGALEALAAMFQLIAENAILVATPLILGTLVVGSALSGLFAEFTAKRAS